QRSCRVIRSRCSTRPKRPWKSEFSIRSKCFEAGLNGGHNGESGALARKRGAKTRVLVIGPYLTDRAATYALGEKAMRSHESRLEEAEGLALAIDVEIVGRELVLLPHIRPATYLAKGKVEEIPA